MGKLKPCPFCGKEIDTEKNVYIPDRDWAPSFYDPDSGGNPIAIHCECGLTFYTGTWDWKEAVEIWNRRVRMKLIDLLATIDTDVESGEKIQICHPGRNWEDYDEFNAGSKLLKPFYDLKVKSLSAIDTDLIRVDLDFDEKG